MNRTLLISILLVTLSLTAFGQDDSIRVDTDLVTLPANVVDRDGKFIIGLDQNKFHVFEDGIEQEIEFFRSVDAPVTVMLLLDISGSMVPHYKQLADAAYAFVDQLRPDDTLFVATFADYPDLVVGPVLVKEMRKNIKIHAHPDAKTTMLFDGVEFGFKKLKKITGRKLIILFSDGIGKGIYSSSKENLQDAEKSDTLVYTIRFAPQFSEKDKGSRKRIEKAKIDSLQYMNDLARLSGARSYQIEDISGLSNTFTQIALEISGQYTLGYYPTEPGKDGERRKINVTVDVPNAAVRSRSEVVYKKK
jgi:hypothetical protein